MPAAPPGWRTMGGSLPTALLVEQAAPQTAAAIASRTDVGRIIVGPLLLPHGASRRRIVRVGPETCKAAIRRAPPRSARDAPGTAPGRAARAREWRAPRC